MTDPETTIGQLKEAVLAFSRERDWEQFHRPKDLGVALACELGELMEHFRYRTDAEIAAHLADPAAHREVAHELADCLWLILRLAEVCRIDLATALRDKLAEAARKYPVELAYGRADKYTRYAAPEPGAIGAVADSSRARGDEETGDEARSPAS